MLKILTTIWLFSLTFTCLGSEDKRRIPIETFSQLPMVQQPKLSPDGKHIAFILNRGQFAEIAITPFDNPKDVKTILQLVSKNNVFNQLHWVNNKQMLVNVITRTLVHRKLYHLPVLYSLDIESGESKKMRRRRLGKRVDNLTYYAATPVLYHVLPYDKEHVVVALYDKTGGDYALFKANVTNGDFTKISSNSGKMTQWIADSSGEHLVAKGREFGDFYTVGASIHDWVAVNKDAKQVKALQQFKDHRYEIISYEHKSHSLLVKSDFQYDEDKSPRRYRLWRYDLTKGEFVKIISDVPEPFDISRVIKRYKGPKKGVVGYRYFDGFERTKFIDLGLQRLSQQIQTVFKSKGLQAHIVDWDESGKRYLVATESASQPLSYYTFDTTKKALKFWYSTHPSVIKQTMTKTERFYFAARDGMMLEGFLTLPDGVEKPPVVLLPHDGPYGITDSLKYDLLVQMIASRGFAVVQVNYRGSGHKGYEFEVAGSGEWGGKMQLDLYDGLSWIEKSGKVNSEKVCIIGQGYGGFAALTAAYQQPDKFRCVVSIDGIYQYQQYLAALNKRFSSAWRNRFFNRTNKKTLSPIEQVDAFKAPVLLFHNEKGGEILYGREAAVLYKQAIAMADELELNDKVVTFESLSSTMGYKYDSAAMEKIMIKVERFLIKHLR